MPSGIEYLAILAQNIFKEIVYVGNRNFIL